MFHTFEETTNAPFLDCAPVPGLQRLVYVGHGVCHDDLSIGVHVSRDTLAAHLHELRGAAAARADALRDRHSRVFPSVQEKL